MIFRNETERIKLFLLNYETKDAWACYYLGALKNQLLQVMLVRERRPSWWPCFLVCGQAPGARVRRSLTVREGWDLACHSLVPEFVPLDKLRALVVVSAKMAFASFLSLDGVKCGLASGAKGFCLPWGCRVSLLRNKHRLSAAVPEVGAPSPCVPVTSSERRGLGLSCRVLF